MKKSRYVSPKSQKKMSSRRAAAAAVVSLGAGILGTQSAEAGIVTIDLTNVGGQNFTRQNAGLTSGEINKGSFLSTLIGGFFLVLTLTLNPLCQTRQITMKLLDQLIPVTSTPTGQWLIAVLGVIAFP